MLDEVTVEGNGGELHKALASPGEGLTIEFSPGSSGSTKCTDAARPAHVADCDRVNGDVLQSVQLQVAEDVVVAR